MFLGTLKYIMQAQSKANHWITKNLIIICLKCISEKCFFVQRYTNADLKISLYVCVHFKTIAWSLILRILELFARGVYKFLKKWANF